MTYPEFFVAPMRQELTNLGVRELKTTADVDAVVEALVAIDRIASTNVQGIASE